MPKEPRSKYSRVFFTIDLGQLPPGKHPLVARATNVKGRVQPAANKRAVDLIVSQLPEIVTLADTIRRDAPIAAKSEDVNFEIGRMREDHDVAAVEENS